MTTNTASNRNTFPKFITDKPEGEDLIGGNAQDRVANNIVQFIQENDDTKRKVIGIEGEWGSGKSNVIEILKKKLNNEYYFYIFDAWGHQEDLTRRSILEGLITKLIKDNEFKKSASHWSNELEYLLAKKIVSQKKAIPQLTTVMLWGIFGFLFLLFISPFLEPLRKSYIYTSSQYYIVNLLLLNILLPIAGFVPLLIKIISEYKKAEIGHKREVLAELVNIYHGKEVETISSETISESEPSVLKFIEFLSKIEKDTKKKLVIVFDNMDRLPSHKVKEVWSSIHTFFASDDNDLKTWAIVPFDNNHICNIFIGEDGVNPSQQSKKFKKDSYIHKTFSIVFHISPPILSAWKSFLNKKFELAFNRPIPPDQYIETIFDFYHSQNSKIKPRDIIYFINDLVALYKIWGQEIELKYLAIFALFGEEILENPTEKILKRNYLTKLGSLFSLDTSLNKYMAALAFNVQVDKAEEVLLSEPIKKALNGQGDLSELVKQPAFFEVFNGEFFKVRPNIIHIIDCLNSLDVPPDKQAQMDTYWEALASDLANPTIFDEKNIIPIKTVIRRLKKLTEQEKLIKYLFKKCSDPMAANQRIKKGGEYYRLIKDIEKLMSLVMPGSRIEDMLPLVEMEPDEFLEFIENCDGVDYLKLKVECNTIALNNLLINEFKDNIINKRFEVLSTLKHSVQFEQLVKHIEEFIPTLTPALPNYQSILPNVIELGKILESNGKTPFVIPVNNALELLGNYTDSPLSVDLILSIIKINTSSFEEGHTNNPNYKGQLNNDKYVSQLVDNYNYYINYENLINYSLNYGKGDKLIVAAIKLITDSAHAVDGNNVPELISKYSTITGGIIGKEKKITDKFLHKLNSFYKSTQLVNKENLDEISKIINSASELDIPLIHDILNQANGYLSSLSKVDWVDSMKKENSPISTLLESLVTCNKFENIKLPIASENAYTEVLEGIARKTNPIPVNQAYFELLFKLNSDRNIAYTFKIVRDALIDPNSGEVTLQQLDFFKNGLFKENILNESSTIANSALRRIITPLISIEPIFLAIVKDNIENIANLIASADESVKAFKTKLESVRSQTKALYMVLIQQVNG